MSDYFLKVTYTAIPDEKVHFKLVNNKLNDGVSILVRHTAVNLVLK